MSVKVLGILFYLHIRTKRTSSEYAENLSSVLLLVVETIAKKYSKMQKVFLTFLAQGDLEFLILMG